MQPEPEPQRDSSHTQSARSNPKRKRNDMQKSKEAAKIGVVNPEEHKVAKKADRPSRIEEPKYEEGLKKELDLRNLQDERD